MLPTALCVCVCCHMWPPPRHTAVHPTAPHCWKLNELFENHWFRCNFVIAEGGQATQAPAGDLSQHLRAAVKIRLVLSRQHEEWYFNLKRGSFVYLPTPHSALSGNVVNWGFRVLLLFLATVTFMPLIRLAWVCLNMR